jgi:hypothetical protein
LPQIDTKADSGCWNVKYVIAVGQWSPILEAAYVSVHIRSIR